MTQSHLGRSVTSENALILDIPIARRAAVADVLSAMDAAIAAGKRGQYISITNTESCYHALRLPEHKRYIENARFSLCDGVGVIVAGWFWGYRIVRLNGPILQLECCKYGESRRWRHFFYGGKEGVAEKMVENLRRQFPDLLSAGTYCPPYRELTPEEDEAIVKSINDARPDVVWVGLGLLKQEKWIARHLDRVKAAWMVGVGAAFDYHSGAVRWAPRWIRALGMEWIFRLILQPKLRLKRYWWSLIFVLQAAIAGLFRRLKGSHK